MSNGAEGERDGESGSICPHKHYSYGKGGGCPRIVSQRNMMDTDLSTENPADLSSNRVASSIPRADTNSTWLYPSPQMFYNALRRKHGYEASVPVQAADMDVIVTIHNMVNEQTWQTILRWEQYYHPSNGQPKLQRFLGRPECLTPKAAWRTYVLGYTRPFDRHDWYVERADGTVARYVIDYYGGRPAWDTLPSNAKDDSRGRATSTAAPPSFFIDARPALDSWSSAYERIHCAAHRFIDYCNVLFSSSPSRGSK